MRRDHRSTVRRFAAIAVAAMVTVLAAGCATAQPDPNSHLGAAALQNLSQFEKRVLADKHVTDAELGEAVQVFTDCLTKAGIAYSIQPGQVGLRSVLMHGSVTDEAERTQQLADHDAKMNRCIDQVSAVDNVWILQNPGKAAGAQPLPGLKQALERLDTAGW